MKTEIKKGYYENGNVWLEITYKNSLKNGIVKHYYYNGKLWYETPFVNGLRKFMV